MELEAVLFDMDGTMIDTEPYWIAAEYALVESFGGTWSDEHAHALVGRADRGRVIGHTSRYPFHGCCRR